MIKEPSRLFTSSNNCRLIIHLIIKRRCRFFRYKIIPDTNYRVTIVGDKDLPMSCHNLHQTVYYLRFSGVFSAIWQMPGDLCTAPGIISLSPLSLAKRVTGVTLGASGLRLGTQPDGRLSEVFWGFHGDLVNARRSVHRPWYHLIITLIISQKSDWRDTRGKWP